jgi:site-specific recombinase XerD
MRFLECVRSVRMRTLLITTYAAGLRVSEVTHLKVTDIDSKSAEHAISAAGAYQGGCGRR